MLSSLYMSSLPHSSFSRLEGVGWEEVVTPVHLRGYHRICGVERGDFKFAAIRFASHESPRAPEALQPTQSKRLLVFVLSLAYLLSARRIMSWTSRAEPELCGVLGNSIWAHLAMLKTIATILATLFSRAFYPRRRLACPTRPPCVMSSTGSTR
jgi:hypothetical protein